MPLLDAPLPLRLGEIRALDNGCFLHGGLWWWWKVLEIFGTAYHYALRRFQWRCLWGQWLFSRWLGRFIFSWYVPGFTGLDFRGEGRATQYFERMNHHWLS